MNYRPTTNNEAVRETLKRHGMYQYQLADLLKINEATLCKWLRSELPEDRQREMVKLIEKAAKND